MQGGHAPAPIGLSHFKPKLSAIRDVPVGHLASCDIRGGSWRSDGPVIYIARSFRAQWEGS